MMLPQAQRVVDVFFCIFAGVDGIVFIIVGFVGEMPRGCWIT
jgi:hypothetical protein